MRQLRNGLQRLPSMFSLMMENGCVENDGFYYTVDECNAFYDGMVGKGLLVRSVPDSQLSLEIKHACA